MLFGRRSVRAVASGVLCVCAVAGIGGSECPRLVSSPDWGEDMAWRVARGDGYAYLLTFQAWGGPEKLKVIEFSLDGQLTLVAEMPWSSGFDIAAIGSYVYSARGTHGIAVIDVAVPAAPVIVGTKPAPPNGDFSDLHIDGSNMYAAAQHGGLVVYDVSDPGHSFAAGSITDPALWYQAVTASGDRAYAIARTADFRAHLQVIDVSIRSDPTVVSSVEIGYMESPAIAVSGAHVYVTGPQEIGAPYYGALKVVDVGDPRAPRVVGQLSLGYLDYLAPSIAATSRRLYVVANDRLLIVDGSDPLDPTVLTEYRWLGDGNSILPFDVVRTGGRLYLAGWNGPEGLLVLDVRQCDLEDHGIPDHDPDGAASSE